MGRALLRWGLGLLGVVLVVAGVSVAIGSVWVQRELGPQESLRSAPQSVDATGCRTLLVEVAGAALDGGDIPNAAPLGITPQQQLAVVAEGSAPSWLVGLASADDVSDRLLGTGYCLASSTEGTWTAQSIKVRAQDPDVAVGGLQGRWAKAGAGETVILPIPVSGQTLVIAAGGDGELTSVDLVGIYRLAGASDVANIALIGGVITAVLGLIVFVVSLLGLRKRGRHENGAPPAGTQASTGS